VATEGVAAGDLSVRAPVEGADELTDLARAFNRMVQEVAESRARIEFLNRMGTWQEMARRLAHEIKNPLTPIQLAVQECHRRYDGSDARFRKLLDTTLEIVEEEVGTLRRLVTEFSSFARLPRASLMEGDLTGYLGEQRDHLAMGETDDEAAGALGNVTVQWELPSHPMPVAFDAMLMHRVLVNVVANAAQAIAGAGASSGQVRVTVRDEQTFAVIDVDDSGPGIPDQVRERIFDPYFTTKSDGNGLGLAIVKKIIVEHGGSIEASRGDLGGARMRIRLPRLGTPSSLVALAHSGRQSLPPAPPSA
jgi:two-component system nitrogen regulation sensor histidine kinase NtrY